MPSGAVEAYFVKDRNSALTSYVETIVRNGKLVHIRVLFFKPLRHYILLK